MAVFFSASSLPLCLLPLPSAYLTLLLLFYNCLLNQATEAGWMKAWRRMGAKRARGADGERRCATRRPHGWNMVICHEAEGLRKD